VQLRHLRYFVKIVEAGSFSRAATTIHVAQPALSQQIAELEEKLGLQLLQRNPRGVTPTPAGEALYREASSILRQVERLPGIVRSSAGEPHGTVGVGMSAALGPALTGPLIAAARTAVPKVSLKFTIADSGSIKSRVQSQELDLALAYEDELVPTFAREPLFRHRLFLVSYEPLLEGADSIPLRRVAEFPLILPPRPHIVRAILDRACAAAGVSLNLVAEIDLMSSTLAAVKAGAGSTIMPDGAEMTGNDWAAPLLIEPPVYTTASLLWSSDFPLTSAGDAVRRLTVEFVAGYVSRARLRGVEWIGPECEQPAARRRSPS